MWREQIEAEAVGDDALQVVIGPRDLGCRPHRVVTVLVADGEDQCGLADATIETGPSATGPWFEETITSSGIESLDAGESGVYQFTGYGRFLRVSAKAATEEGKHCDLTVWLDAEA